MNTFTPFFAVSLLRLRWLQLPAAVLIALLQRTPVLRAVATADLVFISGASSVLKSVFAGTVALGAVDTLVGATTLTANPASPAPAQVGQSFQAALAITGAPLVAGSYEVKGNLPPGLSITSINGDTVNASSVSITGTPTTAGSYTLDVRAWAGTNKSGLGGSPTFNYTITVTGGTAAMPGFATQPLSQTVGAGSNVTFSVSVTGSPPPTLQWRKDGVAISGATDATLTLNSVTTAAAGTYTVVATNASGSTTSDGAVLTVNSGGTGAPSITLQPVSVTARAGSTVALAVGATGATSYQWRKDNAPVAGQTREILVLDAVAAADAGSYTVVATNSSGSATSQAASVAVSNQPDSRIKNLSVRTQLGANRTLIVGFGTAGEKEMLIRAVGPTLTGFGVAGAHLDPEIDFYTGSTQVESNDDWGAALATAFGRNGAFPLPAASLDAALLRTVAGSHTAHARGPGSGVVLVEVYDSGGSGRLINVSALNRVGTGDDVLIAGFVIDGAVARSVLIRAVGPKLTDFNVTGVLANPKLEIFQTLPNGANAKVAENDDWNAAFTHLAERAGAGGLALTPGSKDSAVAITLPPGAYSAVVSGAGNTTGEALVEVYELP